MIYFFINMALNEMSQLEGRLPKGSYCFFQVQNASTRFYGMIKKEFFKVLTDALSAEARENLELLDKNVFQMFFLQNISDNISCIGNRRLMIHLSDENG